MTGHFDAFIGLDDLADYAEAQRPRRLRLTEKKRLRFVIAHAQQPKPRRARKTMTGQDWIAWANRGGGK